MKRWRKFPSPPTWSIPSRACTRGISKRGASSVAFLAVPAIDTPGTIESSLTYALLWFDRARQTAAGAKLSTLRLILPKGKSTALTHRLLALGATVPVVIYQLDPVSEWHRRPRFGAN
jgi:hypothetical protein